MKRTESTGTNIARPTPYGLAPRTTNRYSTLRKNLCRCLLSSTIATSASNTGTLPRSSRTATDSPVMESWEASGSGRARNLHPTKGSRPCKSTPDIHVSLLCEIYEHKLTENSRLLRRKTQYHPRRVMGDASTDRRPHYLVSPYARLAGS